MAFTTQELQRVQRELGYHLLTAGAMPYVGFTQLFSQIINQNIAAEVTTTATLATAIAESSSPTPQALTLASAVGFAAGDRVVVDVDTRAETVTIQSLSGAVATVQLSKAHSGTVPVSLEGPITMARDCLRKIDDVKGEMAKTYGEGALKKVDEIEFHPQREKGMFALLSGQLMYWRNELAAVLGAPNGWAMRGAGSGSCSMGVY